MKTLKYLILSVLFISFLSCEVETEDIVTENAAVGGVQLRFSDSSMGKALGIPENADDLENSTITFADVVLNLELVKLTEGTNITKYEILKGFHRDEILDENDEVVAAEINDSEIVVAESSTLPLSLSYSTLDEFLDGTTMTSGDDLRIGDEFKFRTRVTTSDGKQYFIQDGGDTTGSYTVTVSCFSDLEGAYVLHYSSGDYITNVTETGPGTYEMDQMFGWPTAGYVVKFVDVCGQLEILDDWQWSNHIGGVGVVDPNTGDLVWEGIFVEGVYSNWTFTMYKQD